MLLILFNSIYICTYKVIPGAMRKIKTWNYFRRDNIISALKCHSRKPGQYDY